MTMTDTTWGLPDPDTAAEFYADIPLKRFLAWVVDTFLIAFLTVIAVPLTAFLGLVFLGPFFFPALYTSVNILYRWFTIARWSATPGMRLVSIEFRTAQGERFDSDAALLHTLGYTVSVYMFPLQLVSMVLMLISARRQGLTDHVLGTAAINRAARY